MAKLNGAEGHWYTDENGNHYFVRNGETPKEGWERSKRRKMIDGGKYKVDDGDGKGSREVSMDEYNEYEADDDFDINVDDDFGFDDNEDDVEIDERKLDHVKEYFDIWGKPLESEWSEVVKYYGLNEKEAAELEKHLWPEKSMAKNAEKDLENDEIWDADYERSYGPYNFNGWDDVELLKKAYEKAKDAGMEDSAQNALERIEELGGDFETDGEKPDPQRIWDTFDEWQKFAYAEDQNEENVNKGNELSEKWSADLDKYLTEDQRREFFDVYDKANGPEEIEDFMKKVIGERNGSSDEELDREMYDNEYVYAGLDDDEMADMLSKRKGISPDRAKEFIAKNKEAANNPSAKWKYNENDLDMIGSPTGNELLGEWFEKNGNQVLGNKENEQYVVNEIMQEFGLSKADATRYYKQKTKGIDRNADENDSNNGGRTEKDEDNIANLTNPKNPKYEGFRPSNVTNAKQVGESVTVDNFDTGKEETWSIIEYIPYGALKDGSNRKLYGLVTDYDGSDTFDGGVIVAPSLENAKETLERQLQLAEQGDERYSKRGKWDEDYFNMFRDGKFEWSDEDKADVSKRYGWDLSKEWKDQEHVKNARPSNRRKSGSDSIANEAFEYVKKLFDDPKTRDKAINMMVDKYPNASDEEIGQAVTKLISYWKGKR